MVRLTVVLVVLLYLVLILVPGEDHSGTDVSRADTGGSGGFFSGLLSQAEDNATTPPREPVTIVARADRLAETNALIRDGDGYLLQMPDGEWVEVAAIINPVDLIPGADAEPGEIAHVDVVTDGAAAAAAAIAASATPDAPEVVTSGDGGDIWRVTGDRVNFRAGPSTDDAVLTALVRGDEVEFLAEMPDGWAHLRVVASGTEGYMATRFLEPVN